MPLAKLTSIGQPHVQSLMEKKKQKRLHPELFLDMNWPISLPDHELLQEGTILIASCRETLKVILEFGALYPEPVLYSTHFPDRLVTPVL